MENETIEVTSKWDSNAETIAYNILKEIINTDYYRISPHVSLKEIFKSERKESWMEYHIDFLIEDLSGYPVIGIEINGKNHWNYPECRERDKNKKILFVKAGVPLVCIPLPELPSYTEEEYKTEYPKALRELINNYLFPYHHRTSFPVYCRKCGKQMGYIFKKDYTSFYSCLNKECKFQTISSEKIPVVLIDD